MSNLINDNDGIVYKTEHRGYQELIIDRREFFKYSVGGIAVLLGGCAGLGSRVKTLEGELASTKSEVSELKRRDNQREERIANIESRPLFESSISVLKKPESEREYGTLEGRLYPLYQDKELRLVAERNSDIIVIDPTNRRNPQTREFIYNVYIGRDINGDGVLTPNVDRLYPDKVDGRYKVRFELAESEFIELIKDFLPFVRKYIRR